MAFSPCNYVLLTILDLLSSELHCVHNIHTKLSQMCPTLAKLEATGKTPQKIIKANVDKFLEYMTSVEAKATAAGTYGEVFLADSFSDLYQTLPRLDAVKLVKVAEDEQNDNEDDQGMFAGEVFASLQMNKLDPQHLFFPAFFYCVEVTSEFQNLMVHEEDLENAEYIKVEDGKAPFLLATQKLDRELWEFLT